MPGGAAIRAGRAFVELFVSDKGLVRGLAAASARLKAWGTSVSAAGTALIATGTRVTALGGLLAAPFGFAIKAASDAAETANKFGAVFAEQTPAAQAFAEQLGSSIGRGVTEIQDGLSSLQGFFRGLNLGSEQARLLSQEMVGLAYDFGSFFNVADDESLTRILAGLSGEAEPLKRFGIVINQVATEAELAAMGITGSWREITEQQKVLARASLIKKTMGRQGAIGDAEKTADGFANTWKRVKAQVMDAAIAVGTALLPVMTQVISAVARGIQIFAAWVRENQGVVLAAGAAVVSVLALGVAMTALGAITKVVGAALLLPWLGFAIAVVAAKVVIFVFAAAMVVVKIAIWAVNAALVAMQALLAGVGLVGTVIAVVALGAALVVVGSALWAAYQAGRAVFTVLAGLPGTVGPLAVIGGLFGEWKGIIGEVITLANTSLPAAFMVAKAGIALAISQIRDLWPPLWEFIKAGFNIVWDLITTSFKIRFDQAITNAKIKAGKFLDFGGKADKTLEQFNEASENAARSALFLAEAKFGQLVKGFAGPKESPETVAARAALEAARQEAAANVAAAAAAANNVANRAPDIKDLEEIGKQKLDAGGTFSGLLAGLQLGGGRIDQKQLDVQRAMDVKLGKLVGQGIGGALEFV